MLSVTRPGPGFRAPCRSCLFPSDGFGDGSAVVSTIHKLALHLPEMEVLIHQPGQSLRFPRPQGGGCIPALFPFSMELLLLEPAASCDFMMHRQPQAPHLWLCSPCQGLEEESGRWDLVSWKRYISLALWTLCSFSTVRSLLLLGSAVTVPHSRLNGSSTGASPLPCAHW